MFALLMFADKFELQYVTRLIDLALANRRRRIKRSSNLSQLIYSVYKTRRIFHRSSTRLEAAKLFLIPFVIKCEIYHFTLELTTKEKQTSWEMK